MKDMDFTRFVAVTIDQRHSRRSEDRVPTLLDALDRALSGRAVLAPERTAGDEVQMLLADAPPVVDVVAAALRAGDWWVGIGLGAVETPLPTSTRAARGDAYVAARDAVERARQQPHGLALWTVSGLWHGGDMSPEIHDAETSLLLLGELYHRRSSQGWEVVDLLEAGLPVADVARRLGVSPSAVSQRHRRAGWELEARTRQLCTNAVARALAAVPA